MTDANAALSGIAIVELCGEIATRYCARLFAQHGARVWRVAREGEWLDPPFAAWLDEGKTTLPTTAAALAALDQAGEPRKLVIAGQTRGGIGAAEALVGDRFP